MNYFIADMHYGHENIIKLCSRPFKGVDEMNAALVARWNGRVRGDDRVYILGDMLWENRDPFAVLPLLKGKKVLIYGNHDKKWLKKYDCSSLFEAVVPLLEERIDGINLTLCHYPMFEWDGSRKLGSKKLGWHIYGHIHNNVLPEYRQLFLMSHALNAGADVVGFSPVTFAEHKKKNLAFKLANLESEADRLALIAAAQQNY